MSFEDLVTDAIDSLPDELASYMDNVEVVVEDEPPPEAVAELRPGGTLLGLYHGVPLTKRGMNAPLLPDRISIYRGPITRAARHPAAVKRLVRRVVVHEIAHHFGIDDDRLHELGAY